MTKFVLRAGFPLLDRVESLALATLFVCTSAMVGGASPSNSVARVWDERALAAIRVDTPHPPAQARNLFCLSVAMYDAWAAYDTNGSVGLVYRGKHSAADIPAARSNAISYAAYRMLKERHAYSKTASATMAADDAQMIALGFNPNNVSRDTSTPPGVGNSVYDAVSAWFINDGARQTNGTQTAPYPDYPAASGGYHYINPPLATDRPGITDGFGDTVVDINHWQRLQVVNSVDQNGFPQGPIQTYLGAQWLNVRPCSLSRADSKPWIDLGPPPSLNGLGDAAFRTNVVFVISRSGELTPDDGATLDISPGGFGNSTLGSNDGQGRPLNPYTGLPYAPNVVKRGDFTRVLAEFWADGPNSETPPGHWNVLANYVADHPLTVKKIGGTGPVVGDLEWDVKVYLAVNAAVHDAACAAWSAKRYYDGWRPMSAIRYMGSHGQSSNPELPSYNTNGLPLITNVIELVTSSSLASGRHAGLTPGKIAILSWPGPPSDPVHRHSGVKWIHADTWIPYQRTNFVTPAFPGYFSGHSTFSRSAAEVLSAITGTNFFPGGMGTYTFSSLGFENGPSVPVQLQWATYYDAADQAGLSRIWGGIHPPVDDFAGRIAGSQCGQSVWALAQKYFDGSAALLVRSNTPPFLAPISDLTMDELTRLTFTPYAADYDPGSQTLTFSLDPGAPTGVHLRPDGLFKWVPNEFQGPGIYSITVRVTDNGTPNMSATQSFQVTVNEVNSPPYFINVRDKYVKAGTLLTFQTGVDSDWPVNHLFFTMNPGTAQGATIDAASGVFAWTPTEAQAPGTNYVTVHVIDDGIPPLDATAVYTVHVLPSSASLILLDFSRSGNSVVLNWPATIGKFYQVETKSDVNQGIWTPLGPAVPAITTNLTATDTLSPNTNSLYRVYQLP